MATMNEVDLAVATISGADLAVTATHGVDSGTTTRSGADPAVTMTNLANPATVTSSEVDLAPPMTNRVDPATWSTIDTKRNNTRDQCSIIGNDQTTINVRSNDEGHTNRVKQRSNSKTKMNDENEDE